MTQLDINFITELTFEYRLLHKNFGMLDPDEPFELNYEGFITKLRVDNGKYPETIGVFNLCVYNLDIAKLFDCKESLIESIITTSDNNEDVTYGIKKLIYDRNIDFNEKSKIIFLKSLIVHPKHRKKGVFEELIKSIYMNHYAPNSLFLVSGKPVQAIDDEIDFLSQLTMNVWDDNSASASKKVEVNVADYLKLKSLPTDDIEMCEYKLYAKFQSLNLKQFSDTHFFYFENNLDFWKFLESYADRFEMYKNK